MASAAPATPSPTATPSWAPWFRDVRVNDNGSFIEMDFDLCTPRRTRYEFVLEVTRVSDGNMTTYHSDGGWDGTQPAACGSYTIGRRDRLVPGELYRARLRAYLTPGGKIKSRAVRFWTDA
jgi:hypothetical protein